MAAALKRWAEDLWTLDGAPIRYLSFPYELRMTIVRLEDGSLWLVDELGPVRHLVTPNRLHHLFLGDWADRYPDAAWLDQLDQCVVGPSLFMDEVVFFHRASRTLILGDLVENHDPATFTGWRLTLAKANRMVGPWAETPLNWRITFTDRGATRAAAERLLDGPLPTTPSVPG